MLQFSYIPFFCIFTFAIDALQLYGKLEILMCHLFTVPTVFGVISKIDVEQNK